jgi:hypothetical protein
MDSNFQYAIWSVVVSEYLLKRVDIEENQLKVFQYAKGTYQQMLATSRTR